MKATTGKKLPGSPKKSILRHDIHELLYKSGYWASASLNGKYITFNSCLLFALIYLSACKLIMLSLQISAVGSSSFFIIKHAQNVFAQYIWIYPQRLLGTSWIIFIKFYSLICIYRWPLDVLRTSQFLANDQYVLLKLSDGSKNYCHTECTAFCSAWLWDYFYFMMVNLRKRMFFALFPKQGKEKLL